MEPLRLPTSAEVVDRLQRAFGVRNDSQLARALGLAQTTVSNWRHKGPVPYEACARAALEGRASLDFLVFGIEGDALREAALTASPAFRAGVSFGLREAGISASQLDEVAGLVALHARAHVVEAKLLAEKAGLTDEQALRVIQLRASPAVEHLKAKKAG